MKYIITILLTLSLIGCGVTGSKRTDGALLGGAVGGIAGSNIGGGKGNIAATIGGTLLGAWLGSEVGSQMDERDRFMAEKTTQRALEYAPTHESTSWQNPNSGHKGNVVPTKTRFESDGTPCREYTHTVYIGNKAEKMYGTACRQADGSWKKQ